MAITKRYAHINQASGSAQNKLDAELAHITGSLYVGGEITGSSNLRISGAAHMVGAVQMDSTLAVTDKASFGNTTSLEAAIASKGGISDLDLVVSGSAVFGNVLATFGDAFVGGQLEVGNGAQIQGLTTHSGSVNPDADLTYDLGGPAERWDNIYVGSMQALTVSAEVLSASVDADLNGTLHVAGVSTLAEITGSAGAKFTAGDLKVEAGEVSASMDLKAGGQLVVAGNADLNGTLDVAGDFKVNTDQFIVYASTGNTTINGDLTVNGNVLVDGETFTLDSVNLLVEDRNIILANFTGSGGPNDDTADGGGITITSSLGNKELLWDKSTVAGLQPSFTVNQDWSPWAHLSNSLGQNNQRWQAVYAKTGSFTTVTASAAIKGLTLDVASTSVLRGYAALSGGLGVVGEVSASAGMFAASFDADGQAHVGSLLVDGHVDANGNVDVGGTLGVVGDATLTRLTASVGAEIQGLLSASSLVVENGATFNGQATFVGGFAVPGQGSFGSLVVGGINMSPISSSSPVSTLNAATGSLLTQALVSGDMAKYEIEIIAADTNKATAAAWKISVAALHQGESGIVATATELLKEKIAGLGALLDVDIEIDGNNLVIKAKGTAGVGTVYWDCQIVKKMVMESGTGVRKY